MLDTTLSVISILMIIFAAYTAGQARVASKIIDTMYESVDQLENDDISLEFLCGIIYAHDNIRDTLYPKWRKKNGTQ